MLSRDDPAAPKYWMYESSGVLMPTVAKYLRGERLGELDIPIMRAYLRQWIMSPVWSGEGVDELRRAIDGILDHDAVNRWLMDAEHIGIDPL